ncbi:signal transducer and activator of transcription 5B isoform X2 [Atheta coriaria]|uniref:signal transducer and activator of transcription 5B isoform X2 n=1 Tax=Dalotia coriaria TaxID=877792 RepID=UPI0031F464D6
MAKWQKTQLLGPEYISQIQLLYSNDKLFPIEVRHYLADWIEERFTCDPQQWQSDSSLDIYVKTTIEAFILEIDNRSGVIEDFLTKMKLATAVNNYKSYYEDKYHNLYDHIRNMLMAEDRIYRVACGEIIDTNSQFATVETMIAQQFSQLSDNTREISQDLKRLEEEQETFAINYHDCTKLNAALTNMNNTEAQKIELNNRKQEMEMKLRAGISHLMESRVNIMNKLSAIYVGVNELQCKILDDELIKWKREQQLYGNGATFNNNKLDAIQQWCENLADLIWLNRHSVKEFQRLKLKLNLETEVSDNSTKLLADFTQLLSSLVTSTFIIEKQPPQVMKTNTRFTATVRLLVGGKLNVYMSPPQVRVSIISEMQANVMLKNDKIGKNGDASGEILNNTGAMEYQASTRQLSVSFRNMQLKKIKRAEKKGTESVMDEKFSLLFQSHFSIGGGELMFQVWTLSLPVVVIVHGNQEPHAWATVTWDNAFSEPGRAPFAVPDKVQWCHVADTLSLKFMAATGRGLDEDHLRVLGEKAFRGTTPDANQLLSWAQFCKEPLPDRNFTFWEWFYAVMKLTKEHLRGPWVDGAIIGFIRKTTLEEMLLNCPYGTFALRFSDSELGGITIAWITSPREVFSLQPNTAKDFSIRSLADRIRDLDNLVHLFPNINKDEKFGKYYTENQPTNTTNGYVKSKLITTIDRQGGGSINNTPLHMTSPEYSNTRDTNSVARYM